MSTHKYAIHWFRRDLRIAGNTNLRHSWKVSEGRVLGIFCFDSSFLKRSDFSHNRFAFFLKTLIELKKELLAQGGDLLVINEQPQKAFPVLFKQIGIPEVFSFGADYEPFSRSRDENLKTIFESFGVKTHSERDHVIIEPHEVLKDDKSFYQVYSPYFRRWFEKINTTEVSKRIEDQAVVNQYYDKLTNNKLENIFKLKWSAFKSLPYQDSLDEFIRENNKSVTIPIPEAGFKVAFERLQKFKYELSNYSEKRNLPYLDGTSRLSIYQKNGSLVSSQIISLLGLQNKNTQYVKEIAWREFYYSIMYHRPECEKQAYLPQYINLNWENDEQKFERWCEGKTGFPIVDAGMRQLNQTGWMHNRVRMIVASFLVKDLLIDWRWGENYFMKMLLDGDLAPNNGGWQWAASTGCDPQPYFRIFNPWLQAEKFDPECEYIKTYIPELKNLSAKVIHNPEADRGSLYPTPMVQHSEQKIKAIALFKTAKN
jgi:deoxyribodipyrimidine photo-lyase